MKSLNYTELAKIGMLVTKNYGTLPILEGSKQPTKVAPQRREEITPEAKLARFNAKLADAKRKLRKSTAAREIRNAQIRIGVINSFRLRHADKHKLKLVA